ncbi:hypothetical protein FB567DRAFT_631825 [Paraphoma chrysanthemicola]|uniref:Uncharacterized protein n=1 Tax=Paraphoma chrysanthemicola TaxID=798071 RepID=A0A8K0R0R4_9PLEO|nr:hypothetical protein FB567DRAFT_631825 [Paraphoma chrysanthemicola]
MTSTNKPTAKPSPPACAALAVKPNNSKNVKVVPGSQVKIMSAAINANKEAAALAAKIPISLEKLAALEGILPRPQRSVKKEPMPQVIDFGDISLIHDEPEPPLPRNKQKPQEESVRLLTALSRSPNIPTLIPKLRSVPEHTATPTTPTKKPATQPNHQAESHSFEQRLSLQRMKDDALTILEQRKEALVKTGRQIANVYKATDVKEAKIALRSSMETLTTQVKAIKADIRKLELFGDGFNTSKIKGVDKEAIVALTSWGVAVNQRYKAKGATTMEPDSGDGSSKEDIFPEDDLFGIQETPESSLPTKNAKETSHKASRPTEITKPSSEPLHAKPAPVSKSAPKDRPGCSVMVKPKRPTTSTISRPQKAMPLVDPSKAQATNIIDAAETLLPQGIGKVAEKKQNKGKNKAFIAAKGMDSGRAKPRMRRDEDGDLKFRKKYVSVAGEKRKRVDVMDQPNKRPVIGGRSLAPLRGRRALATSGAVDVDGRLFCRLDPSHSTSRSAA